MGKNSLIKSTTKHKKTTKGAGDKIEKKKTVKAKAAPKLKSKTAKTSAAKPKAAKSTAKAPVKKPTYKDLIFKKFDTQQPAELYVPPADQAKPARYTAPPYVAGDEAEIKRIKTLLFTRHDWQSVKAAAEKAATEKIEPTPPLNRIEPEQKANVSYSTDKYRKPMDPQSMTMKLVIALFALLVLSALVASFSNNNTYSLIEKNGGVEVWKGKFVPVGKKLVLSLPGAVLSEEMETSGSDQAIFPFVVNHYLHKADRFLEETGTPDFRNIRAYLDKARPYAISAGLKKAVDVRLTTIQLMSILYRAEVAASKETPESLERALVLLEEADGLDLDNMQAELVMDKREAIRGLLAGHESAKAETASEPDVEAAQQPLH